MGLFYYSDDQQTFVLPIQKLEPPNKNGENKNKIEKINKQAKILINLII